MSTIRVKAAPGRRVPIHPRIAKGPDDRLLVIGDEPTDLPDCSGVRRRMRAGDLVMVPAAAPNARAPQTVTLAAGPPAIDPKNPKES